MRRLSGRVLPDAPDSLSRLVSGNGNEVTIKFPPGTNQQGQQTSTWVTLRRLSGEDAMIPRKK